MIPVNEIELLIKYREENLARDLPADREVGMEIVNVVREWFDDFLTQRVPDLAICASPECGGEMEASLPCIVCGETRPDIGEPFEKNVD